MNNLQTETSAKPLIDGMGTKAHAVADRVDTLAHRGVDAMVEKSHALLQSGINAQDATVAYILRKPVKSVLIAAASGAALATLFTLLARRN